MNKRRVEPEREVYSKTSIVQTQMHNFSRIKFHQTPKLCFERSILRPAETHAEFVCSDYSF